MSWLLVAVKLKIDRFKTSVTARCLTEHEDRMPFPKNLKNHTL